MAGIKIPDTISGAKTFDSNLTISNSSAGLTIEDSDSTGNNAVALTTYKNSDSGCSGVVGYNTTSSNIFSVANSTGTLQLGSAFSVQIDAQDGLYNITFPSTASHTYATSGYASLGQYSSSNGTLELASLGSIDLVMDVNNNSGGKKVSFRTNGKGGAGTEVASIQDTGLATFTGDVSVGGAGTIGNVSGSLYVASDTTIGFLYCGGAFRYYWSNTAFAPNTDNTYDCGEAAKRWDDVYATNGTIQTSDERLKENITDSDLGLNFINSLRPVSYTFKNGNSGRTHYGIIAQELEQVLDGKDFAGLTHSPIQQDEDGNDIPDSDTYGMRYTELVAPLIKAVQELKAENDSLKARIEAIENA